MLSSAVGKLGFKARSKSWVVSVITHFIVCIHLLSKVLPDTINSVNGPRLKCLPEPNLWNLVVIAHLSVLSQLVTGTD